jgi:hypothetical protein
MKVIGFVFLCIVATISGLPATTRSPAEPDDCSKECINGVIHYGHELSILKNPNLSNYFNKIDEICEVITTAQKCLEKCGATSNPFALESLNIVCQPDTQERIASIKQCLHYVDTNLNEICSKECSSDHIIDETDVTTPKMNPMLQKANGDCANFKCMARCNIEVVSNQCGKELAKEFHSLLQQVVDTQRKDLEKLKLVDAMAKEAPEECNYLYDPSVLFGGKPTEEQSSTPSPATDPKEDAKALYAQAQLQLLLKQLELAEKQDQLIDRENAKLDMEMSYMAHKAEQREHRFHAAHALPTYVPMEKMPKEPMSMEPLHPSMPMEASHSEQMPESQPPMEEPSHPEQMPSEEPNHPEHPPMEPHPPMEAAHPPMPMEHPQEHEHSSMPPMDFPHPIPMESIPEEPRNHKMPKNLVMIDGIPMEFIPMEAAPFQMPMEAMPRFL